MASNNLNNAAPAPWRPDPQHCCIYKIPREMRQRKPEAYTPQKVLIGPLNYQEIVKARADPGNIGNLNAVEYLKMEEHKVTYQKAFEEKRAIEFIKNFIRDEEWRIRASYSEPTAWIQQQEFLDMIYRDSVFIIEFLRRSNGPVQDDPLHEAISKDLMLLENQLPYFIFEPYFISEYSSLCFNGISHRDFVSYFGGGEKQLEGEIKHLTDLLRRIYVDTLDPEHLARNRIQRPIHNAAKLEKGGVKLVAVSQVPSILVRYGNGSLEVPRFTVDRMTDLKFRNIMALEQLHYQDQPYVCNYVMLLSNLTSTERDVDVLAEKGILTSAADNAMVAEIIHNLSAGLNISVSYLANITRYVNNYYNERNGLWPVLRRTYFPNLWATTATIVAVFITISTVGSFIVALLEAKF